jgi:hypothetical protein
VIVKVTLMSHLKLAVTEHRCLPGPDGSRVVIDPLQL